MSFTAQSVIDLALTLWREKSVGDIMTPEQALLWVNQAVVKVREKRSDARFDDSEEALVYSGPLTADSVIPMADKFQLACVYFLTAHGFGRSADQQNLDKRFGDWMGLFKQEIEQA